MKRVLVLLTLSPLGPALRAEQPKEFLNVPYGKTAGMGVRDGNPHDSIS